MSNFSDEEFVGYTFNASPPRRPRLWFLDRQLDMLFHHEGWAITDIDTGVWTLERRGWNPVQLGPCVRYQHEGTESWTAVWRLTDTVIEHVHTFGLDDDVWRLGVWPD
jgi:hypothetical protein